jgi:hypothetical protein
MDMLEYYSNKDQLLQSKARGGIEDNLQDNRAGYWLNWNQNNHCSGYTLSLIQHIVSNATLHFHFISHIEDGGTKIIWKRHCDLLVGGVVPMKLKALRRW